MYLQRGEPQTFSHLDSAIVELADLEKTKKTNNSLLKKSAEDKNKMKKDKINKNKHHDESHRKQNELLMVEEPVLLTPPANTSANTILSEDNNKSYFANMDFLSIILLGLVTGIIIFVLGSQVVSFAYEVPAIIEGAAYLLETVFLSMGGAHPCRFYFHVLRGRLLSRRPRKTWK